MGEEKQQMISSRRQFLNKTQALAYPLAMSALIKSDSVLHAEVNRSDTPVESSIQPKTGLVLDDRFKLHSHGPGHPESPERLKAIEHRLKSTGLLESLFSIDPVVDPDPYIGKVHSEDHIKKVAKQAHSEAICRLAVSAALSAVDEVCSKRMRNAFAAIRPPGHHAANGGEFGFCFYNNVAIAARYAQERHNLGKILIVDWDYHHGDGTEWAFYDDPSVLVFSTHALRAFPGTGFAHRVGSGEGKGYNINVPLPKRATDQDILTAFRDVLMPAAEKFQPNIVLVSAGFDSRVDDRLGTFQITDDGFSKLTAMVMDIAQRHSESRIVSLLEGGYNTKGLAMAVETHLRELQKA